MYPMVYSIYGHISYILEANSKMTNDFSLIGRKPCEKEKKPYGIKIQAEIKFKIYAQGE